MKSPAYLDLLRVLRGSLWTASRTCAARANMTCDGLLSPRIHLRSSSWWTSRRRASIWLLPSRLAARSSVSGMRVSATTQHALLQRRRLFGNARSGLRLTWSCPKGHLRGLARHFHFPLTNLSSPSPSAEFGSSVVFLFIHYVDKDGMRNPSRPFNDIEHISLTRTRVERQVECMARQHLLPNGERNMVLARWKFEPCRQTAPWTLSVDEMNPSAGSIQDRPFFARKGLGARHHVGAAPC
jgi:hypothetical protein